MSNDDLKWFGIRSNGQPILDRVKTKRCKKCNGFGTYGNPLCGALYNCNRCNGSGYNPGFLTIIKRLFKYVQREN